MQSAGDPQDDFSDAVRNQLARVLASPGFSSSKIRSRFLSYVIEAALQTQGNKLKEYVLGVEVFGRSESFDPRLDSIVRVHATHVRRRLREYYRTLGQSDPVRIDLPVGSYVPLIERQSERPFMKAQINRHEGSVAEEVANLRPAIAVLPCVTPGRGEDYIICDGIAEELIGALAGITGIRVMAGNYSLAFRETLSTSLTASQLGIAGFLEIAARRNDSKVRVIARLFSVRKLCITWVQDFESDLKEIFATERGLASLIAAAFRDGLQHGTMGI